MLLIKFVLIGQITLLIRSLVRKWLCAGITSCTIYCITSWMTAFFSQMGEFIYIYLRTLPTWWFVSSLSSLIWLLVIRGKIRPETMWIWCAFQWSTIIASMIWRRAKQHFRMLQILMTLVPKICTIQRFDFRVFIGLQFWLYLRLCYLLLLHM